MKKTKIKRKTVTFPIEDVTLTSQWRCKTTGTGKDKQYYFLEGNPTTDIVSRKTRYSIPSGAKIESSTVYAKVPTIKTGASILKVRDVKLKKTKTAGVYSAPCKIDKNETLTNFYFTFKANGSKDAESAKNTVTCTITLTKVYLEVIYTIKKEYNAPNSTKGSLAVPPQSCALYRPDTGAVYMFDGVIRIQHNISVKIEEEPDGSKYEYVNNAIYEPDKVTLDVMMSDVYKGSSDLDGSNENRSNYSEEINKAKPLGLESEDTRSGIAYSIIRGIQRDRVYLTVITPQHVYTEMMISSFTANQDETCPYGWSGQIVFQGRSAPIKPGYGQKATADAGDNRPTQSGLPPKGDQEPDVDKPGTPTVPPFNPGDSVNMLA